MVKKSNSAFFFLIFVVAWMCGLLTVVFFWPTVGVYVSVLLVTIGSLPVLAHLFAARLIRGRDAWKEMRQSIEHLHRDRTGQPPVNPVE